MERFMRGDVVITPFPFSDLTSSLKRPALVITSLKGEDTILCQITTKERNDPHKVLLTDKDFSKGRLKVDSYIRPTRLFTLRKSVISYRVGSVSREKINKVTNLICNILKK